MDDVGIGGGGPVVSRWLLCMARITIASVHRAVVVAREAAGPSDADSVSIRARRSAGVPHGRVVGGVSVPHPAVSSAGHRDRVLGGVLRRAVRAVQAASRKAVVAGCAQSADLDVGASGDGVIDAARRAALGADGDDG